MHAIAVATFRGALRFAADIPDPMAAVVYVGRIDEQRARSEEHTSELQSQSNLVCRLLLEKKKQDIRADACFGFLHTDPLQDHGSADLHRQSELHRPVPGLVMPYCRRRYLPCRIDVYVRSS